MFWICSIVVNFWLTWKGGDVKKTKRLTHEELTKQLIESMVVNEVVETDQLNKQAEEDQKPEDAADLIKQYENIIRTKKKGIMSIAYHERKVFIKFKDKEKFITLVNQLKIHKTTLIFNPIKPWGGHFCPRQI